MGDTEPRTGPGNLNPIESVAYQTELSGLRDPIFPENLLKASKSIILNLSIICLYYKPGCWHLPSHDLWKNPVKVDLMLTKMASHLTKTWFGTRDQVGPRPSSLNDSSHSAGLIFQLLLQLFTRFFTFTFGRFHVP